MPRARCYASLTALTNVAAALKILESAWKAPEAIRERAQTSNDTELKSGAIFFAKLGCSMSNLAFWHKQRVDGLGQHFAGESTLSGIDLVVTAQSNAENFPPLS